MVSPSPSRRGARHHHEVGVAARDVERVIRLERDIDRAAAALRDQVEAVVEELAEQGEQRVVGRGVADVGRDVRDQDGVAVHLDAELVQESWQGRLGRRDGSRGGLGLGLGLRKSLRRQLPERLLRQAACVGGRLRGRVTAFCAGVTSASADGPSWRSGLAGPIEGIESRRRIPPAARRWECRSSEAGR